MVQDLGILEGGLALDQNCPTTLGRKSHMSLEKSQARKEIREGKQLTISGILRVGMTLKSMPK